MNRKFDIFISYATVDLDIVAPFVKLLKRDGFKVWFDIEQMRGGLPALGQLADGIANSAHTIACLSDAYLDRPFTLFELQNSMYRDPSGKGAGTIPVKFRPLTVEIPNYLSFLAVCDLTDQKNYDRTYRLITELIPRSTSDARPVREPPASEAAGPDADAVERACDIPFQHLDDPNIALFQVRRAVEVLAKFLYRRELGEIPANATLDSLIDQLVVSGKLPQEINAPLAVVQTYGRYVVRDQMDAFLITTESIAPALAALRVLTAWVLPDRKPADPWAEIWESLPIGDHQGERRIPDTSYHLRAPRLSRNSLGPLFTGRNAARNEPVSVNLVTLPPQSDDAFFEEVARFMRLSDANIVSPLDAGRVVVDGRRRCLYLIMPSIDGVSAQDLTEHLGALPARAAYELCAGIASALVGFHEAYPPIVHGDIKPANVLVGAFGTVRVLCIGREVATTLADARAVDANGRIDSFFFSSPEQRSGAPLTPRTDLFALHSVLYYLLSGAYPTHSGAGSAVLPVESPGPAETLDRLARCRSAAEASRILEEAYRSLPDSDSLRSVNQCYREDRGLTGPGSADFGPVMARHLRPVGICQIDGRRAWPIGDGRVLVWEMGTNTLATFNGPELLWRDGHSVLVRLVTAGIDGQVAVGGWDGAVRYFADGALVAALKLDGAVGDLQFTRNGLVAGSWKRALWRISSTGKHEELLGLDKGVHRIAVTDRADRFAVADLSGGLAFYASDRKVADVPALDGVTDLAYAGTRLVVLTDDALTAIRLDGSRGSRESRPGALRLLPAPVPDCCLLLIEAAGAPGMAPALEAWLVDEADRQIRYFTLPAGHRLLSASRLANRLALSTPDGGCAYWRDGEEVQVWPDALAATISADGSLIAITRPGRVELYEDSA